MLRVRNPNLSPPPQVRDVYIPHYSPRLIRLLHLIHIHLPPSQLLPHHRTTMVTLVRLEDLVTIHAGLGSRATSIISSAISVPGATVDSVQPIIDEVVRIYGNPVAIKSFVSSRTRRSTSAKTKKRLNHVGSIPSWVLRASPRRYFEIQGGLYLHYTTVYHTLMT